MSRKPGHLAFDHFRRTMRPLASRRAGIALVVALSAPLLIAATGLSVDVGYWYQQQESLQSAADAGALAAATAQINFSTVTTQVLAEPFAVAAANGATNNQFGLTDTTLSVIPTPVTVNNATATEWRATATAPRGSFFSRVKGMGLSGVLPGTQSATAAADYVPATASDCLETTGTTGTGIQTSGVGLVEGVGCGIFSDSTGNPAISGAGGAIEGTSVGAMGSITGSTGASTLAPDQTTDAADPLAAMGAPPPNWPTMPSIPSTAGPFVTPYDSYNAGTANGGTCASNAYCADIPGDYDGMNINAYNLTLNSGTNTGTTYIEGGLSGNENGALTMNGDDYYIGGAGVTTSSNTPTNWAWTTNTPNITASGGTYYVNGGLQVGGSNATATFGSGFYMFNAYGSSAAFDDTDSSALTLNTGTGGNTGAGGGTFFFDGGLTVEGSGNITFGPGIYYIENGDLNITAGGTVTGNGVTFVLENGAGFNISGGTKTNLSAPTTNCVSPSDYPESTGSTNYATAYPYDGTDGEGICGVLIYQARTDAAAATVDEGASTVLNGYIYAPDAALTDSGAGSIAPTESTSGDVATITGSLGIIVKSANVSGSGSIILSEKAGSAGAATSSPVALLVQ